MTRGNRRFHMAVTLNCKASDLVSDYRNILKKGGLPENPLKSSDTVIEIVKRRFKNGEYKILLGVDKPLSERSVWYAESLDNLLEAIENPSVKKRLLGRFL